MERDRDARRSGDRTRAVPQEVLHSHNLKDTFSTNKSGRQAAVEEHDAQESCVLCYTTGSSERALPLRPEHASWTFEHRTITTAPLEREVGQPRSGSKHLLWTFHHRA